MKLKSHTLENVNLSNDNGVTETFTQNHVMTLHQLSKTGVICFQNKYAMKPKSQWFYLQTT